MKKNIYLACICLCLLLTACEGKSFLSTIVVKNNSRYSYYYVISCDETYYKSGGTIQSGSTIKTKVQSEHSYNVSTYDMFSIQLHTSNYVNARSDKTYTITINN